MMMTIMKTTTKKNKHVEMVLMTTEKKAMVVTML